MTNLTPAELAKCREELASCRNIDYGGWADRWTPQLLAAAERCAEIEAQLEGKVRVNGIHDICEVTERMLKADAAAWRAACDHVEAQYPTDIFGTDEDAKRPDASLDCRSARMARLTCRNIRDEHDRRLAGKETT